MLCPPIVAKYYLYPLYSLPKLLSNLVSGERFRESFEKFCIQAENMPYLYSRYKPNPKYSKGTQNLKKLFLKLGDLFAIIKCKENRFREASHMQKNYEIR